MEYCTKWKDCKHLKTTDEESTLELVSSITELNDLHEFLSDDKLDEAMETIVKISMNPNLKPATAAKLIVQLQALSAMFAFKATYYQTIGRNGAEESHKKNVYYTAKDSITKLVDALKYTAKSDIYG